ncbi:MAG: hypothetical protein LBM73_02130 [Candidatus Nomurabacteria bacterium]|jgi:hypothetical protein|nr:hypothetical protein [Candidatus Nomurabacteria bacterium]
MSAEQTDGGADLMAVDHWQSLKQREFLQKIVKAGDGRMVHWHSLTYNHDVAGGGILLSTSDMKLIQLIW